MSDSEVTKSAMVTGASSGIGRSFAKALANEGYTVTVLARNESRLKELLAELPEGQHRYIVADLARPEGVDIATRELGKNRYNLLVNNAGVGVYGPFSHSSLPRMQEMMRLNCDAVAALSHAFLRQAEDGDALMNVSSMLAFLPLPNLALYAASKAFVTSLSESLWYENLEKNIYVMNICPGSTETEFSERAGRAENRRPPKSMMQTADQVVAIALRALKKRKRPTVMSGIKNFAFTTFTRLMPRRSVVRMMGRVS